MDTVKICKDIQLQSIRYCDVKTLQIVCQAHPREPGHELGVASGWTWRLPQGVAMLIRNKTYISLLFAGSNWAGIILRPVGGDPRVMLVMSCKNKTGTITYWFQCCIAKNAEKGATVQPQELYVRTAWTTMENHKKFVHYPLSPSFFFPDFNVQWKRWFRKKSPHRGKVTPQHRF